MMRQRAQLTQTNKPRLALSLEPLEDRCTPAGLQLTSLLVPPMLPSVIPAIAARLGLGDADIPVPTTVSQSLGGSAAIVNNVLSLGESSRILGLDFQTDAGGSLLPVVKLTLATGTDGTAGLGLDLHVGVGGTQLIDVGLSAGSGNGAPAGLDLQASVGGGSLVAVTVNTGTGGELPVEGTTKAEIGAPSAIVVNGGASPNRFVFDLNLGASATGPVTPPNSGPQAPLPNTSMSVGTPVAAAVSVVPLLVVAPSSDRAADAETPTLAVANLVATNQPAIAAPELKSAPMPGAGEQDDTFVPNADTGALVTDFRVTNESSTTSDQILELVDNGSAPDVWSLIWKSSSALVLLLATSFEMRRRRRRGAVVSERRGYSEWFPGLAELPN